MVFGILYEYVYKTCLPMLNLVLIINFLETNDLKLMAVAEMHKTIPGCAETSDEHSQVSVMEGSCTT